MRVVCVLILAGCIAVGVGGVSALDYLCDYKCVLAAPCNNQADVCLGRRQGVACYWCDSDFSDNLCVKNEGTACMEIEFQENLCGDAFIGYCTGDPLECVGYRPGGECQRTRCSL